MLERAHKLESKSLKHVQTQAQAIRPIARQTTRAQFEKHVIKLEFEQEHSRQALQVYVLDLLNSLLFWSYLGRGLVHEPEDARNGILFTGGEDRNVTAWDTANGKVAYTMEDARGARVKGIVALSKSGGDSGEEEDPYTMASASSDGVE